MSSRPGSAAYALVGLAAWALFLAVLSGHSALLLVALPPLVALLLGRPRPDSSVLRLSHEISANRVLEGDEITVKIAVRADEAIPIVEICHPLPPGALVVSGTRRAVFSFKAGRQVEWQYTLRCVERGRFTLGRPSLRAWDGAGLYVQEWQYGEAGASVSVYPRAAALHSLPHPRHTQLAFGNYAAARLGEGLELAEVARFAPGDRIRWINWRASLRLGGLHVNRFHQERNADIVLVLDTSSEAGVRPHSTLDHSTRACAALASAYLARRDRVGLIEYSGLVRWTRPATGRVQLERIMEGLVRAEVTSSYVRRDLDVLPPRILPPQALVIAVTPLLDERFLRVLRNLAGRGFDLVVLAVHPVDLNRRAVRFSALDDLASRLWRLIWRDALAELALDGIPVIEWHPDRPLELALASFSRWARSGRLRR
jgi:uncharacterized protein (DUF58 family)